MNLSLVQLGGLIVCAVLAVALAGIAVGVWASRAGDYPQMGGLTDDLFDAYVDEACALTEPLPEVNER